MSMAWVEWTALALGVWALLGTVVGFLIAPIAKGALDIEPHSAACTEEGARALQPRILVVDDDAPLRSLLRATLAAEFDVREVGSGEEALQLVRFWRPALALLDVNLPGMDGLTLARELGRAYGDVRVILLTGEEISQTTARLAGAKGVLRKPFSPLELLELVALVLDGKGFVSVPPAEAEGQLLMYARDLARIAQAERRQRQLLQEAYRQTATALADAVDVRDPATSLHAQRVRLYALELAEIASPALLDDPSLEYGFLLHDVGKIGVPDHILLKPGTLTPEEHELVRRHPQIGAQILRNVALLQGSGLEVVRHHHERWDGAGYPDGLMGEQIPLGARIFAVADTLDAMTSDRPYRRAGNWNEAVDEIAAQSGRQFDPRVVQAFVASAEQLRAVHEDIDLGDWIRAAS
jgi:ribonuclease P protein subunit RPR2